MRDGRSHPPPVPPIAYYEVLTANINGYLHTNYRPDEIESMPELWLHKMILLTSDG